MRHYRGKTRGIFLTIAVVVFSTHFAANSYAQRGAPGPGSPPPNPLGMSDRDLNILDREAQLTRIEKERRRAVKSDPQLAFTQIKDDFRRLQTVNNDVMRAVSSGRELDYKYISDSAREIKKRAARLKVNLVFPEAEGDEGAAKLSEDSSGLKPSLEALDGLISSFVTNPVFKEVGVVDTKLGVKARRDLDRIIELSEKVRKSAEKMSKNAGK
jgi:hypothetical protein